MTVQTTTHLNFRGDARAALDLYASVFDGHAAVTTYAEVGMPADLPGADRVVFGVVAADNGFRVMAYDVPGEPGGTLTGGATTRRENGTTITDQAAFVAIALDSLGLASNTLDIAEILATADFARLDPIHRKVRSKALWRASA